MDKLKLLYDNIKNDKYIINTNISDFIILLSQVSNDISNNINIDTQKKVYDKLIDIINNLIDSGVEINMKPDQIIRGGYSKNIWPIMTELYKNSKKLSFTIQNIEKTNFEVIAHNNGYPTEPILGKGTFTAVYEVKNKDGHHYILRFTEYNLRSSEHFLKNKKIINEYVNYGKYLPKRYYYGNCNFNSKEFKFNDNTYTTYTLSSMKKNYNFQYFITKKYPILKKNLDIIKNQDKFKLLINLVKFLLQLYNNNRYHADLKIDNISYDENYVPILIDYDENTIIDINNISSIDIINSIPSTYYPMYITGGKDTNNKVIKCKDQSFKIIPQDKNNLNLFSIGGLVEIINNLKINFTTKFIDIPLEVIGKSRRFDTTKPLHTFLNLCNTNYNNVYKYDKILKILEFIRDKGYIINNP